MNNFISPEKFILLAGPCAIESEEIVMETAKRLKNIVNSFNIDFYFKASFDKANRTTATKFRGPGLEEGLRILKKVKECYNVKIVTDIHEPEQATSVAEVADIIQIPAFLCRQTDLLKAAAETGKIINVKKAQFIAPMDMKNVAEKVKYFGNEKIILCERGSCFGYNRLVVDMIGLAQMKELGYPVLFDATHSVQLPGTGDNYSTGGMSKYVKHLAKAATAVGIDGLFLEVHPEPEKALCDAKCMVKLDELEMLLKQVIDINDLNNF